MGLSRLFALFIAILAVAISVLFFLRSAPDSNSGPETEIETGPEAETGIQLTPIGQYSAPSDESATEISAFDPATARLFVVDAAQAKVEILDLKNPADPVKMSTIDISGLGASANSVAVKKGVVAIAIENENKQANGVVAFFSTDGELLSSVIAGALPDMLTFNRAGDKVLVANEGEPSGYCESGLEHDPEGSVSIIDLSGGVAELTDAAVSTATFTAFNSGAPESVRIFGQNATVAQDLEPEYIAISGDDRTAYVALQENNALAVVDIATATVTNLMPLGTKDHSLPQNALDASNRDDSIRIESWPVHGMYQPDAIATYIAEGETYIVTANEGDARNYKCFSEEKRVKDLSLDPAAFPDADTLKQGENLGRLNSTTVNGDADGDGRHEKIYSYGARSFSIWNAAGEQVWDSGDSIAQITAERFPQDFNSQSVGSDTFDSRSDDKGAEPEGLDLGIVQDRTYAFVGLERIGGILVYDITDPKQPDFIDYVHNLAAGSTTEAAVGSLDVGPEGVLFIPESQSPVPHALLVVANEISSTVTVYSVLPRS